MLKIMLRLCNYNIKLRLRNNDIKLRLFDHSIIIAFLFRHEFYQIYSHIY